jgi:hypothetical protein
MTGQNAPAKIAVRPSIEKAADTEASTRATANAASLTGVIERRAMVAAGVTVTLTASVTVGVTSLTVAVTDVATLIASAPRRIRPKASDRNTIGQATAFGLMAIDYREPGAVCEFQPQHQLWGSGIALSLHAICESVIPLETELTTMEVKVALWAGDVDRARTLISKRMGLRIRAGSRGTTGKTVIPFRICESPMLYVPGAALVIVASS